MLNLSKILSIINVVGRLILQAIFTLLFALIVYHILRLFVHQIDVDKEYFPHGYRFPPEQQLSNEYRLKIARDYLVNSHVNNSSVKVLLLLSFIHLIHQTIIFYKLIFIGKLNKIC